MNFKKLLGGGLLATVLALGVGAGLAVRSESQDFKQADASVVDSGKKRIYFDAWNINWIFNNDHVLKIHYFGGSSSSSWPGVQMTDVVNRYGRDMYFYDVPDDTKSVIFTRSPSASSTEATNRWDVQNTGKDPQDGYSFYQPTGDGTYGAYISTSIKLNVESESSLDVYIHGWDGGVYTPANPTVPSGKAFEGWYTDSGFENEYVASGLDDLDELELFAKLSTNVVDVSQYAVVDGVAETTPFNVDPIPEGSTYAKPDAVIREGYHFGGWYTTAACSTEYTPITVDDDMSIYAKYTTITLDSYIYWTDKDSSALAGGRVYYFGEYKNSWDEGPLLSSYEVSGGAMSLHNEGHLYKIPVPSIGDYQIILHNGSNQTSDMTVTPHSIYYTAYDHVWESKSYYSYSAGDDAMAAAADFLAAAEAKRNAAQFKGLNYTVCGVSQTDAQTLINTYDTVLDDEARGYVNDSIVYTYNPAKSADEQAALDPKDQTNITYDLIVAKLREIASGNGPSANTKGISLFGDIDNSTPIMLVVIISVVSLTAVGGYIFLKRRKEN